MSDVVWWDGEGVTPATLKAEVIKLGTKFPDKVVHCTYSTNRGVPICIVGQAVFNITGKVVDNNDWFGSIDNNPIWVKALGGDAYEELLGFSPEDYEDFLFVKRVQRRQDKLNTWGYAIENS